MAIDQIIDPFLSLFQCRPISFVFLLVFLHTAIPWKLGLATSEAPFLHARSTIINSGQCHRLTLAEREGQADDSSGLLRTYCIIPFNYCSLDSAQPLIRRRCSARPHWGRVSRRVQRKFILDSCPSGEDTAVRPGLHYGLARHSLALPVLRTLLHISLITEF